MTLKREDIKKLVIQQMLQESVQEEGVLNWMGKGLKSLGNKLDPQQKSKEFNTKLQAVADFIQMNRNTPLVKNSKLGKLIFNGTSIKNEAYEDPILQILKSKEEVNEKALDEFIAEMAKNPNAKKQLESLLGKKLDSVAGSSTAQANASTPTAQSPSTVAAPQAATSTGGQNQTTTGTQKPGTDDVIAVFKGKTGGPKGAGDSLNTQLTKQFGSKLPKEASGKLITAISKDLMNQLKVNGLKVQENIDQIENFLLKEMVNNNISKDSLSFLLKEELTEDYNIAGDVLTVLMEAPQITDLDRAKELGYKKVTDYKADLNAWKKQNNYDETDAKTKFRDFKLSQQKTTPAPAAASTSAPAEPTKPAAPAPAASAPAASTAEPATRAPPPSTSSAVVSGETRPEKDSTKPQDSMIVDPELSSASTPAPAPTAPAPTASAPAPTAAPATAAQQKPVKVGYGQKGFDNDQIQKIVNTLPKEMKNQGTKIVTDFSNWLKLKASSPQQQSLLEAANVSKLKNLFNKFKEETNLQIDQNLFDTVISAISQEFGDPGALPRDMRPPKNEKDKAAAAAAANKVFTQVTPAKAGSVNVGQVVGTKLKAIAQLNAKAGLALVPIIPSMLQAIEKFIGFALAKSGKKDSVKILGGTKNAVAIQKTIRDIAKKGAMDSEAHKKRRGVSPQPAQTVKKEALKEAIVEEIFNLLTGKTK